MGSNTFEVSNSGRLDTVSGMTAWNCWRSIAAVASAIDGRQFARAQAQLVPGPVSLLTDLHPIITSQLS